jgi:hypothetical protein
MTVESLPNPGPPIVLVVTVDVDGQSSVRYTTTPEYAATALRAIADGIVSDVSVLE